jgi:spore coat protein H
MRIRLLVTLVSLSLLSFSQNTKGDVFFGSATIHTINLNFAQTGYWDSLVANYTADVYMSCNMIIDGTPLNTSGVKFKGNSSYNNPSQKKSFKLDFNEYVNGQNYDGLKKLNLNNGFKDPTFLREKLMLDFLNRAGIAAPRCTYAKVYINNTYWGLYMAVEEIDKIFLDDEFFDDKGNLFKGDPNGDLKWLGSSVNTYTAKYELKTNETQNNWTDLVYLIDKINNSPGNLPDSLNKILQVTPFLKAWAASNMFANLDSYIGSGHNYFIYHDSITNKFNWITWDVNEAFGNFNQGMTVTQIETMALNYTGGGAGNRPLCNKIIANPTLYNSYINEVCYLTGTHFLQSYWFPRIDSLVNVIKADVYADPNKFFTNAQFDANIDTTIVVVGNPGGSNIPGIKSFFNRRRVSLVSQLASNNCFAGLNAEIREDNSFTVKPNPTNGHVWVKRNDPKDRVVFYDLLGKPVDVDLVIALSENESLYWLGDLPKGIYVCRVGLQAKRVVRQ